MTIELKIKAKHLAAEAKIIKHEEHKLKRRIERAKAKSLSADKLRAQRLDIADHRRSVLREEARSTHLARACIKGTPYRVVEKFSYEAPNLSRVIKLVEKYSSKKKEEVLEWYNTPWPANN
jgi:hypothetical protein